MKNRWTILELINFDKLKIFESAKWQNNIITSLKKWDFCTSAKCLFSNRTGLATPELLLTILKWKDEETLYFHQNQDEIYFWPWLSIQTRITEEWKISFSSTKIEKLWTLYDISQWVVEATDKISKKISQLTWFNQGDWVFVLSKMETEKLNLLENEKQIIKKYLNTESVKRYGITFDDEYLIFSDKKTRNEIANNIFPNIKKHLDFFNSAISSSNWPYGLHRDRSSQLNIFERPKLICKWMFDNPEFTFDNNWFYIGMSFSVITQNQDNNNLKYLLWILNSSLWKIWFHKNWKRRGVGVDIGVQVFKEFPIPVITHDNTHIVIEIERNVDKALEVKKSDPNSNIKDIESKIDELVYKLYNLTPEEIVLIEGSK